MTLLSDDASELARRIRKKVGPDTNCGGAGSQEQIIELWKGKDPGALVPAIEDLESYRSIRTLRRGRWTAAHFGLHHRRLVKAGRVICRDCGAVHTLSTLLRALDERHERSKPEVDSQK